MIHRIILTIVALLPLLGAQSMHARPMQDSTEVLTELALATMLLMGDASAFSDDAYRTDSNAHLGLELRLITLAEADRQSSGLAIYSGYIVGSSLWYTAESRQANGIFNRTHHDMWSAPIIDPERMQLGPARTDVFDSLGINTLGNEGFFAINGSMLVYTGCNYIKGFGDCDLLICNLSDARPELWYLPKTVNSKSWESQPALDDDLTLFFTSNREGDDDGAALFYAVYDTVDKSFRQSVRLPRHVNHAGQCGGPFVIPGTSLLIYTAVTGTKSSSDYWCTQYTRNDSGELVFSKPKRLPPSLSNGGKPISFSYDRVSRTIVIGLEKAASLRGNKQGGGTQQLYYVRLPESL